MRRRSNAIHSDSTQEFLLLAQLSQDSPGYFYDDKVREEIDRKISKKKPVFPNPEHICQTKFEGFDFNSEIQCAMEEKKQLQIKTKRQVLQLTIKTDDVKELKAMLTTIFTPQKLAQEENHSAEKRILDMFLVPHGEHILKIWMVSCEQKDNPLLKVYTNQEYICSYNTTQNKNVQALKLLLNGVIASLSPMRHPSFLDFGQFSQIKTKK